MRHVRVAATCAAELRRPGGVVAKAAVSASVELHAGAEGGAPGFYLMTAMSVSPFPASLSRADQADRHRCSNCHAP